MLDWEKIRTLLAVPLIRDSNEVATELSTELVARGREHGLPEDQLISFHDMRPQECDIAFAILEDARKPIGIAKLALRPSNPVLNGYLGIWFLVPLQKSTRTARRHQKTRYLESIQMLSNFAFKECGLKEVWTHIAPSDLHVARQLKAVGFKQRETRVRLAHAPIKYLEYSKSIS